MKYSDQELNRKEQKTFEEDLLLTTEDQGINQEAIHPEVTVDTVNRHSMLDRDVTGGDLDTDPLQAELAGEEAVGGTAPTPEQNRVEDVAIAAGVPLYDQQPVQIRDMVERRDEHRWELDPASGDRDI